MSAEDLVNALPRCHACGKPAPFESARGPCCAAHAPRRPVVVAALGAVLDALALQPDLSRRCVYCDKPARATHTLCFTHYHRVRRGRPAEAALYARAPKAPVPCSKPGCIEHAAVRGMCRTHYRAVQYDLERKKLPQCLECGTHTKKRDEEGDPVCATCQRELRTPAKRRAA